jgi:PTS system ascorbate-specific IIC component
VALGHFCTIGYLVQAAVAKVVGKGSRSTEDLELPDNFKFLQDTYLAMAVVMVPMYLIRLRRARNISLSSQRH